jgi:hypothetical protein
MNSLVMDPIPPSDEFLSVELDWDFDAETGDCENDLDYLAEATSLSNLEPINSNPETFPPYPIDFSNDLPFIHNKEIVAPQSYCQSPSDVHSVKTVSDTSSTADSSFYSSSESSLEGLDQGSYKEKRSRPVLKAKNRAVTTRRSGWKKPKNAPKRYLSAYNIFFSEERRRVHAESGQSIGFEGLGKRIGQRWTTLTDEQREPYYTMAEKGVGRYREEMKMFEDNRRKKYVRLSSSVTIASTISPSLSDDSRSPSPGRVSPALPSRQPHQYVHYPPPPTVYAPQMIMPDQHHYGQYHTAGGHWQQQQYVQQYAQQPQPNVQYECYRMTRKEAQNYMQQCAGGQHFVQASL